MFFVRQLLKYGCHLVGSGGTAWLQKEGLGLLHHYTQRQGGGPGPAPLTLTCSLEVTAQKTISVKPWVGNIRKQIPPMTRPSLIKARVLCFLGGQAIGHWPCLFPNPMLL